MQSGYIVKRNEYKDSVFLMRVAKELASQDGITGTAALMATAKNKQLLAEMDVAGPEIETAGPNDLVLAAKGESMEKIEAALARAEVLLHPEPGRDGVSSSFRTLDAALASQPRANLAVISVPGEYAGAEAQRALERGLNVFLFSNGVPLEDELSLKRYARDHGLIVMGPDCGTAIIGGVGVGFANAVRRGPVGAIGSSGTGLQEFTTLVHNAGAGISHAIGTGSHDLSDGIGGLTTLTALDALEADPPTKVIALISKPPGAKALARLGERLRACKKPVVGCFLGAESDIEAGPSFQRARLIDEAARLCIKEIADTPVSLSAGFTPQELERMSREAAAWSAEQKYIRALFAGGTFCYQSQQIFRDAGIPVHSNVPLEQRYRLADPDHSVEHTMVDMGDDHYTVGRPHPMIDGTMRRQRILAEARNPEVAILLLDFILGYNASLDPVGELLGAIAEAKRAAQGRGGALTVVASVCGTDGDPQDPSAQARMLEESGVIVFRSNAKAARFCCELIKRR